MAELFDFVDQIPFELVLSELLFSDVGAFNEVRFYFLDVVLAILKHMDPLPCNYGRSDLCKLDKDGTEALRPIIVSSIL